jgi:hypothetical protein
VPPIRLYVFISFIFFLVIAAVSSHEPANEKGGIRIGAVSVGALEKKSSRIADMATMPDARLAAQVRNSGFEATEFNKNFARKIGKFSASSPEERNHKIFKNVSLLMFALMPLFGLIVQSVYSRQKKNYIQYLIFSIHFHCFAFLVFSIAFLLGRFTQLEVFSTPAFYISILYLLLALQYLYKQSWLRTILKTMYISGVYLLALMLFLVIAVGISVALI